MIYAKSFKAGDWVSFSKISQKDNGDYYIQNEDANLCLFFINSKKCVYGKSLKYLKNKDRFWFDIERKEILDMKAISRDEFIKQYENYDIEIHKYRTTKDKSWHIYYRRKKEYNWKYDLSKGVNKNWVHMKKDMYESYLKDFEYEKNKKNTGEDIGCKSIIYLENSFDDMVNGFNSIIGTKNNFINNTVSFGKEDGSFVLGKKYYEIMLKNYFLLKIKYENKLNYDFYYMILDFEDIIKKIKDKMPKIDYEIVKQVMGGEKSLEEIATYLNINFKNRKVFNKYDIHLRVDMFIPSQILSFKEELERKRNKGD